MTTKIVYNVFKSSHVIATSCVKHAMYNCTRLLYGLKLGTPTVKGWNWNYSYREYLKLLRMGLFEYVGKG